MIKFIRAILVVLGFVLLLTVAVVIVWSVQGDQPGGFASGLAAIGSVVGGLSALAFTMAQNLEGDERGWINREGKHLFSATIYWLYAALAQYVASIQMLQGPLRTLVLGMLMVVVGLMFLLAVIQTGLSINRLLEFLTNPDDVARIEREQSGKPSAWFKRMLGR